MPKGKRRKTGPKVGPNPIDIHVGARLKLRRHLMGISQTQLGDAVGLTFQQVQKYERGSNRVGCSRLFEFSKILTVPISYFFDDMPKEISGKNPVNLGNADNDNANDPLKSPETKELAEAYYRIPNPKVRKEVFELFKEIARS